MKQFCALFCLLLLLSLPGRVMAESRGPVSDEDLQKMPLATEPDRPHPMIPIVVVLVMIASTTGAVLLMKRSRKPSAA